VPPRPIRQLRDLTRYRKVVIQERTREAQRLEKVLEDAGVKLSSVASDILGVSGRAMLAALIGGNCDPAAMAALAKGRLRAKLPELRAALRGHFDAHHGLLAAEMLGRIDAADETIQRLSGEIDRVIAPLAWALTLLETIPGVARRTAEVIVAETGADMRRFPSAAHLASWAGMCPGNDESAGKRRSGKTRKGSPWLRVTLTEAAYAAGQGNGTYLSARYHRLLVRRGKKKAAIAVGHSILVIAWHLLANDCDYADLGGDFFVRRDSDRARQRAVGQLQALGYRVTLEPLAA
jgi:transposase